MARTIFFDDDAVMQSQDVWLRIVGHVFGSGGLGSAVLGWWRRRRAAGRSARADAGSLVDLLGADGAYHEARRRARLARTGAVVDHDRPPRHWTRVSIEIIRRSDGRVGLDTATRYLRR